MPSGGLPLPPAKQMNRILLSKYKKSSTKVAQSVLGEVPSYCERADWGGVNRDPPLSGPDIFISHRK